jgi:hypothetical protein
MRLSVQPDDRAARSFFFSVDYYGGVLGALLCTSYLCVQ